jgi:hypothetical protein
MRLRIALQQVTFGVPAEGIPFDLREVMKSVSKDEARIVYWFRTVGPVRRKINCSHCCDFLV